MVSCLSPGFSAWFYLLPPAKEQRSLLQAPSEMSSVPEVSRNRTWPRKKELLTLGPINYELFCGAAVYFVTLTSMMSEFSIRFSAMGKSMGEEKDM